MSSMYPTRKKCSVFGGLVYRVVHRSAISTCMQVLNSGVMSIYSFSYCRLLTRMTSSWLARLKDNFSFTFRWHKAAKSMTGTLFSCFYIHTTTETELRSVYVFLGPFRWWKVACLLIQKALFKDEKPDKDTYLGPLFLFPVHPMVKKQSLFLTPMSFVPVWPPWPVPTSSPVAVAALISD